MARVQKNNNESNKPLNKKEEPKKVTKGEITLQIAVGTILLALIAVITVIIIQLVSDHPEDNDESVFDNFVEVGTDDLDIILRIAAGETDIGYESLSNSAARNLLVDTEKRIYLLFYSSVASSYQDDGFASLETALTGLPSDGSGDAYLILVDVSVSTTAFDTIKTVFDNHEISLGSKTALEMPDLLRIRFNYEINTQRFTFINNKTNNDRIANELQNVK